ncbi:SDR family oxidoreductase [Streptosporangium sp. NBC_01755]|uniref:SDR family oxidoreductase n=1 Tax=Streptosporangium sp. NBC_01755 TaxID=2975949 RepID=UPI002DD9C9A6|nr:SDR family oxidoreductase [Streptosporangium sp. NBC_01755]WSD00337.1 SDR family oxidoreductase [Streptosporangium sp. NBC_01755]
MTARRLEGRTALVTGASRGIGLAIAHRLVDEGARVCITARKETALKEAVEELGPDVAFHVAGSAADPDHQQEAIDRAVERWGGLDLLVNNTGINPAYGSLLELEDSAARKIFEVNLLGTLGWTRRAWHTVLADRGGAVVNVASVAGLRPAGGIGFYGATKAALMHLTQQLAVELSPTVRVNAVAPAVVRTRFATALFEGKEDEVTAAYPVGRLGEPEDIAAAVAYLGSDDAAWTTGQTLVLDGGLTLNGGV